jgi:DNA replicative helicase MCM subunit Mcm2 (Cdc46/Mcm family)
MCAKWQMRAFVQMPAALLSRFDLAFVLLDRPDAERDQLLSEHIMDLHGRSSRVRWQLCVLMTAHTQVAVAAARRRALCAH